MFITKILKMCCISTAVTSSMAMADNACIPALKDSEPLRLETYHDGVRYINLSTPSTQQDMIQIATAIAQTRNVLRDFDQPQSLTVILYNYYQGQVGYNSIALNPALAPFPLIVHHQYGHIVYLRKLFGRFPFLRTYGDDKVWADVYFAGKHMNAYQIAEQIWNNKNVDPNKLVELRERKLQNRNLDEALKAEMRAKKQWANFEEKYRAPQTLSPEFIKVIANSVPFAELFSDLVTELMLKKNGNEIATVLGAPYRSFSVPLPEGYSSIGMNGGTSTARLFIWKLLKSRPELEPEILTIVAESTIRSIERLIALKTVGPVDLQNLNRTLIEQIELYLSERDQQTGPNSAVDSLAI